MKDEIIPWRRSPIIIGVLLGVVVFSACGMIAFLYGLRTEISTEMQAATVSALTATPTSTPLSTPTPSPTPTPVREAPVGARLCGAVVQIVVLGLAVAFLIFRSRRKKGRGPLSLIGGE